MTGELADVSVIGSTSLAALISTHTLPADTRLRAAKSLRGLEQFPLIGAPLDGRWESFASCSDRGDGCCSCTSSSSPKIALSW